MKVKANNTEHDLIESTDIKVETLTLTNPSGVTGSFVIYKKAGWLMYRVYITLTSAKTSGTEISFGTVAEKWRPACGYWTWIGSNHDAQLIARENGQIVVKLTKSLSSNAQISDMTSCPAGGGL